MKFKDVACVKGSKKWEQCIERKEQLYTKPNDIRSEFARDYTRILHSLAYRRLKHKTQVFFATRNDHVCTRMEHVAHVESVSHTIAQYLGLNTELTSAIAMGHDLGHAPFGHEGGDILKKLAEKYLGTQFWHEGNSLWFVDNIETLPNPDGEATNLNLTYAVRDGIVMHCGEVDESFLKPREEYIPLETVRKASQYSPFTWEGCVVKISDKIAYLGRDIEDAMTVKILDNSNLKILNDAVRDTLKFRDGEINTTSLMHLFTTNLCEASNPADGFLLAPEYFELMQFVKDFNTENIYFHSTLDPFKKYAGLIIETIFHQLVEVWSSENMMSGLEALKPRYKLLYETFLDWLVKYSDYNLQERDKENYKNRIIYSIADKKSFIRSVIDFISGMTDSFAIRVFMEITSF